MSICTITGTIYDANGDVKSGALLTITPLGISANLMHNASFPVSSNSSGVVSFDVVQGAQYSIKGFVLGFEDGLTVTIPASSSVSLESLVASSLVPSSGLTVKDEGTALASLIGTLNFVGSGVSVEQTSTGVAEVEISAGGASNLDALSDVTLTSPANDDILQRKAGVFVNRSLAQLKTDLSLSGVNSGDQDLSGYSLTTHNHSGTYEPANANIQSHIANTSNPHGVTKTQVGLGNVDNLQQLPLSYLDTDTSLAANSDVKVASQKAVKAYVDAAGGGSPGGSTGDIQYNNAGSFAASLLKQGTNKIEQRNGANSQSLSVFNDYGADDNYNKILINTFSNGGAFLFIGQGAKRIDSANFYVGNSNPGGWLYLQAGGTNAFGYDPSTGNHVALGNSFHVDAGVKRVSTQFDKTSNTTLADITGLSAPVFSGRTFNFRAVLYTTSNASGGVKVAMAGTATASAIIYEADVIESGVLKVPGASRANALGGTVGNITAVTVAKIVIEGTITVSGSGTLTVQFAQNASDGNASSVLVGSYLRVSENP